MIIHRGASKRERLIGAAEEAFAADGFQRATVPAIAALAGVSAGLLYRYFPGKAELAQAIVEQDRDRTRTAIEQLVAYETDPRRAFQRLVEGWVDEARANPPACALIAEIAAESRRDEVIRRTVVDAEAATTTLIENLLRRGSYPGDPKAAASLVFSALDGLVMRVAIAPEWDPRPAARELVIAILGQEAAS